MPRTINVQELTLKAFGQYGTFANMIKPQGPFIGKEPILFFRDMIQLNLGGASIASFSVCQTASRPLVVEETEYHSACGEGIMPLDGDVIIHVAPATPNGVKPFDSIEAFMIPKGTMVILRPGVWHHAPFCMHSGTINTLIVLPERTYANGCQYIPIPDGEQIKINRP